MWHQFSVNTDAVDGAGHSSHWGSDLYYEIVQQKEYQLQALVEALENTTTESGKVISLSPCFVAIQL